MQANLSKETPNALSYLVMKTALVSYQKSPNELDTQQLQRVKKQAMTQYKIESVVLSSDEAKDISVPEAMLESTIKELVSRYENSDAFYDDLAANDVSYDDFREAIKREMYVEVVMDRVASKAATVSDVDARIYYHLHPEKFIKKETRKISHILVTVNEDYAENSEVAARERIEKIFQVLSSKPKKFADLALKHSECPTAMQKGQLGDVTEGMLFPELDEVAFTLKKGEISQILRSEMGFHILKCEGISHKQTMSTGDALPKVKAYLEEKQRNNCKKHWLAQQLKQYNG